MLLQDKVIIVTGAGSGIGFATSVILAKAGANVVVSGRNGGALDKVSATIGEAGGSAIAVMCDVSDEAQVVQLIDHALSRFGRLDGAFNNAGMPFHNKRTDELAAEEWDAVLNMNTRGVFLCMKHEIRAMQKSGGGAIVNNSSVESMIAVPGWTEYTTSKHAVNGLTRGAASEARQTGVRVNAVLPGYIVTPMSEKLLNDPDAKDDVAAALERHSVGRFGQPEDVGFAVKWLLSDEAAFVNGAMLAVDGGSTAR